MPTIHLIIDSPCSCEWGCDDCQGTDYVCLERQPIPCSWSTWVAWLFGYYPAEFRKTVMGLTFPRTVENP